MTTITLNGSPMNTYGDLPLVGTRAPDFTMTRDDMSEIRLGDCAGKQVILNIFPSLDTPTCAAAVVSFNELASKQNNLMILCISMDLPFAQKRFCTSKHLDNVIPVSAFRNTEFGKNYGVVFVDGPLTGLLSRAVVVVNQHGMITYTEQVRKLEDEPNYQAALEAVSAL